MADGRKTIRLDEVERLELWDALESITEAWSSYLFDGNSMPPLADADERQKAAVRVKDYIAVVDELGWDRSKDFGPVEIEASDALRRLLPEARKETETVMSESENPGNWENQLGLLSDVERQVNSRSELARLETDAVRELAEVAQRHANRLPARSKRRPLLIKIANLQLGIDEGQGGGAGDAGGRRTVFTPEEREAAEAWVGHKIEDAVGLNFVRDILDGCDHWVPLLRAIRERSDLTDRQADELRQVAEEWRTTYSQEIEGFDADHVDRPATEKAIALAGSIIATLAGVERVTVDA